MIHGYHPAGKVTLLSDERFFVDRGSILYLNWRPANVWRDATGTNATVNAQIDTMAAQLSSVAPRKIMLSLFGEPERFVTPGTSTCPGLKGTVGLARPTSRRCGATSRTASRPSASPTSCG